MLPFHGAFYDFYNVKNKVKVHIVFWLAYLVYDAALEYAWMRETYSHSSTWHLIGLVLLTVIVMLPPKLLLAYFVLLVTMDRGIIKNRRSIYLILEVIPVIAASLVSYRLIVHYYVQNIIYY